MSKSDDPATLQQRKVFDSEINICGYTVGTIGTHQRWIPSIELKVLAMQQCHWDLCRAIL